MSDNTATPKVSLRRRRLRCLMVLVVDMYHATAFSSRAPVAYSSSRPPNVPRAIIDSIPQPRGLPECGLPSHRLGLEDTGHDRQKLQQSLLPLVKEYQRIQAVLNQHGKISTPRLHQAILCGYVRHTSLDTSFEDGFILGDHDPRHMEFEGLDRFEWILEEGPRARELLITSNIGLVRHVVDTVLSSYYHIPQHSGTHTNAAHGGKAGKKLLYSLTRQDLIQEGTIGLARAIDKYDASLASSAAFSTYAYYWIRAAVLRAIAQKDELVRVPEHVTSAITKIVRAANRLGLSSSHDFTQNLEQDILHQYQSLTQTLPPTIYPNGDSRKWEEAEAAKRLADEAGVSLSLLKDALNIQHRRQMNHRLGGALSLEPWMTSSSPTTTQDHTRYALDENHADLLKESLSKYVNNKEMEALCLRYGLFQPKQPAGFRDYEAEAEVELFGNLSPTATTLSPKSNVKMISRKNSSPLPVGGRWGEAMSFAEVGKQMQISAEYGRRLVSSALKKLKQAAEDGRLDAALQYL